MNVLEENIRDDNNTENKEIVDTHRSSLTTSPARFESSGENVSRKMYNELFEEYLIVKRKLADAESKLISMRIEAASQSDKEFTTAFLKHPLTVFKLLIENDIDGLSRALHQLHTSNIDILLKNVELMLTKLRKVKSFRSKCTDTKSDKET